MLADDAIIPVASVIVLYLDAEEITEVESTLDAAFEVLKNREVDSEEKVIGFVADLIAMAYGRPELDVRERNDLFHAVMLCYDQERSEDAVVDLGPTDPRYDHDDNGAALRDAVLEGSDLEFR
jgi:hypothetical protein